MIILGNSGIIHETNVRKSTLYACITNTCFYPKSNSRADIDIFPLVTVLEYNGMIF